MAVGEIDLTMKFTRWKSANVEAYMGTGEYGHIQVRVRGAQQPDVPCESGIRKPVTDENSHLCKKEEHGYQIDQEMTLREIMIMMKIKLKDLQCSFS